MPRSSAQPVIAWVVATPCGARDEHLVAVLADGRPRQLGQARRARGPRAARSGSPSAARRGRRAPPAARRDDPPLDHHRDAVGEVLRLVHEVRREEDGLARRAEVADRRPGVAAGVRIEARRRLVEEQDVGVADEAEREVQAPALPAGERAGAGVALGVELDEVDELVGAEAARVPAAVHLQQLADRQLLLDAGGLQDDADPVAQLARRGAGVIPEDRDAPRRRDAVALGDLGDRRLAGPVGPQQAEHLAVGDVEADAADGHHVAVALVDLSYLDCGHAGKVGAGARGRKWRPAWIAHDICHPRSGG